MIYFIPNILSEEECKFLVTQFDLEKPNTKSVDDVRITPNAFGFRPSDEFNIYLDKYQAERIGMNYNDFVNKITSDWWISGVTAINDNILDNYAFIECDMALYEDKSCPLLGGTINIFDN